MVKVTFTRGNGLETKCFNEYDDTVDEWLLDNNALMVAVEFDDEELGE